MRAAHVASLLQQAAHRRTDIRHAKFEVNPSTTDHSGINLIYTVLYKPDHVGTREGEGKKGEYKITKDTPKYPPGRILEELLGKEAKPPEHESSDRKAWLNTPLERIDF